MCINFKVSTHRRNIMCEGIVTNEIRKIQHREYKCFKSQYLKLPTLYD
jgi:hypothetical protein